MKTAAFHTLGCKVNQYDTQAMLEKFRAAGYEIVPFDADADVYVINTCTVTGTGDKKSLQLARRLRREHPDSALILAGCLAQRKPEDLLETGARLVIGTQHRGEVVELLEKALRENTSINAVNELNATTPFEPLTITSQEEHTRATLKIQEGCNNHCTYCIIPSVRGPIRSRPVDEIRALIAITGRHTFEGGRRVVLIEQADKMNPPAQNALLKTLEEPVPGTIFLLMTESPSLLLPTIVSRCRELKLHPWDDRTVLSVLEKHGVTGQRAQEALHVSGGSIGKALAVAGDEQYWQRRSEVMRDFFALERRSDILRISSTWKDRKDDAEELLDDVEDMLRTLLLCHLGQRSESAVTPYPAAWQRFSREGELSAMMRLLDAVAQARQMRANQVTWQAVVERLLLSLMEEKSKWST